jgi:hypothetical protein
VNAANRGSVVEVREYVRIAGKLAANRETVATTPVGRSVRSRRTVTHTSGSTADVASAFSSAPALRGGISAMRTMVAAQTWNNGT